MKVLVAKVFYNKDVQTDAAIDQAIAARLAAGDGYTINSITESIIRGEDFLDDIVKTIKRPTLIIWGRQDGLVPLAEGERFNKDIAGSKLDRVRSVWPRAATRETGRVQCGGAQVSRRRCSITMKFSVGDSAEITKTIEQADIDAFADVTGDHNPVHVDEEFAKTTRFGRRLRMEC